MTKQKHNHEIYSVLPPGYEHAADLVNKAIVKVDEKIWEQKIARFYNKKSGTMQILPPLDDEGEPLMTVDDLGNLICNTYHDSKPENRYRPSLVRQAGKIPAQSTNVVSKAVIKTQCQHHLLSYRYQRRNRPGWPYLQRQVSEVQALATRKHTSNYLSQDTLQLLYCSDSSRGGLDNINGRRQKKQSAKNMDQARRLIQAMAVVEGQPK